MKIKESLLTEEVTKKIYDDVRKKVGNFMDILDEEDDASDIERELDRSAKKNLAIIRQNIKKYNIDLAQAREDLSTEGNKSADLDEYAKYTVTPSEYFSVLLEGMPGAAKTASVKAWCKKHNCKLVTKDLKGVDEATMTGVSVPTHDTATSRIYRSAFLDEILDDPETPCVLFLDEFNRAIATVRGTALTLTLNHAMPYTFAEADKREVTELETKIAGLKQELRDGNITQDVYDERFKKLSDKSMRAISKAGNIGTGELWLPNLLLVVAAMNPDESPEIEDPTGSAESDRYRKLWVEPNEHKLGFFQYALKELMSSYANAIEMLEEQDAPFSNKLFNIVVEGSNDWLRRLLLLAHLYAHIDEFNFTTHDEYMSKLSRAYNGKVEPHINPRAVTQALKYCDGTKEDFISEFEMRCGSDKVDELRLIFDDYTDPSDEELEEPERCLGPEIKIIKGSDKRLVGNEIADAMEEILDNLPEPEEDED